MNIVSHSVPQDSNAIKTTLPYNRKYVLFAIYEVLDKKGAEYEKINATTILSGISVYGPIAPAPILSDHCRRQHLTAPGKRACDKKVESLICNYK